MNLKISYSSADWLSRTRTLKADWSIPLPCQSWSPKSLCRLNDPSALPFTELIFKMSSHTFSLLGWDLTMKRFYKCYSPLWIIQARPDGNSELHRSSRTVDSSSWVSPVAPSTGLELKSFNTDSRFCKIAEKAVNLQNISRFKTQLE